MLGVRWWTLVGGCGVEIDEHQRAEHEHLVAELGSVGFLLPGTISARQLRCTHAGCHCHGEPPMLHGPYWYWTRKVAGKTVSMTLSAEQAEEYGELIANEHRARALLHDLEAIGLSILESDPRTPRRRR